MEKIKMLINKDQYDSFKKAGHDLSSPVNAAYEDSVGSNMYITIEADTINTICRICYLAGYYQKDLIYKLLTKEN